MAPRTKRFDETLALYREGYRFIANRCAALRSDSFETRLMLRKVTCLRGREAAQFFYAPGNFERSGAMPVTVLRLLQDYGSVQLLEGERHVRRKAMFLDIGSAQRAEQLADVMERIWIERARAAQPQAEMILFDEIRLVLTAAAAEWAGIPRGTFRLERLCRQLSEMIEASGSFGWRNLWAQILRNAAERWAREQIRTCRAGRVSARAGTPLAMIAGHTGTDGRLLAEETAAVELLNVLRPIVAVGRFIVYAALKIHERDPERVLDEHVDYVAFAQEIRRWSPFFPFIGGRALRQMRLGDHSFAKGDWVLLDIHGTNHHDGTWADPDVFSPARVRQDPRKIADIVAQGAGDVERSHRCPGEGLTVSLTARAVKVLTRDLAYDVPPQDLTLDLSTVPALPRDGVRMRDVRTR